jgi:hypothetical protein
MQLLRAPLAAVCWVVVVLVAAPAAHAWEASVPPVKVDGNPSCADYGLTAITKFDPVASGTKNGVTITKHDEFYVKWTSTVAVDWVIVKGGPDANIYKYPVDTFGDDWLHAPINPDTGKPYGLSHVEFCGDRADIKIVKTGPATAYVDDTITYTFTVTNTGDVTLKDVSVSDAKCTSAPVRKAGETDTSFDPGDVWTYTCQKTITADTSDPLHNVAKACGEYGESKVCDSDDHDVDILHPAIEIDKTGAAYAYAGDTVTYHFAVKNSGDTTLTGVTVTDPRCTSAPVRNAGETDTSFDPTDVWNYTCTAVVPAGVTQVDNTAEACGTSGPKKVCDSDDHSFPVRTIAIQVDKAAVEQTAVAGSVVHFTISVKNTGGTSFVSYVFDDPKCDEQRTGANAGDATLDPGETWTYSCAMATQPGQTLADNTATATGTNSDGRSATDDGSASIPLTQPVGTPQTPPPGGTPPQGGTLPAGGTLPETAASGRARLRGPSGCVKRAFRARVTGRSITSVAFYVDGKLVKRFTANRSSYSIKVKPRGLGFGRHRIVARVKFLAASGTEARSLPLTFRRCARAQVTPQFTG